MSASRTSSVRMFFTLCAAFVLCAASARPAGFYTESYAEYDGYNGVSGYSRTWNYHEMEDAPVGVDAELYGPSSQLLDRASQDSWGLEAIAYVYGLVTENGTYSVSGQHYYQDINTFSWIWVGSTYYPVEVGTDPEIWSVDPPGPWYAGETYNVTVWGQGFLGQIAHACGGADSDNLQVWSDSMISGDVHVSSWPNSGVWICVGAAVFGLIEVLEPEPPPTVSFTGGAAYVLYGSSESVLLNNLVQAVGNPPGGQYAWSASPNRLTISETSYPGVVQLEEASSSTSVNDITITVRYTFNGRTATATRNTTATIYRYLTQAGQYVNIACPCPEGRYGYDGYVRYNTYAQPGNFRVEAGGLSVDEYVTQVSVEPPGFEVVPTYGTASTDGGGQFTDRLAIFSSSPLPSNLRIVSSQDLAVESIYVRSNTLTFSNSTVTIGNNGPFL